MSTVAGSPIPPDVCPSIGCKCPNLFSTSPQCIPKNSILGYRLDEGRGLFSQIVDNALVFLIMANWECKCHPLVTNKQKTMHPDTQAIIRAPHVVSQIYASEATKLRIHNIFSFSDERNQFKIDKNHCVKLKRASGNTKRAQFQATILKFPYSLIRGLARAAILSNFTERHRMDGGTYSGRASPPPLRTLQTHSSQERASFNCYPQP